MVEVAASVAVDCRVAAAKVFKVDLLESFNASSAWKEMGISAESLLLLYIC
jgi:hypothetical protein